MIITYQMVQQHDYTNMKAKITKENQQVYLLMA